MILLSNYYKSAQIHGQNKRLIIAKKIENSPSITDSLDKQPELLNEADEVRELEVKKKQLLQEIEHIEKKMARLEVEMSQKLAKTEEEISTWWITRQEEVEQLKQQIKEEATQEGYQEGYNQGYQQVMVEFEGKLMEAEGVIRSAYEEKEQIIQEAEPFLLSLSVKITEKIIQQHIAQNESTILELVRQGLEQVGEKGEVTIQVSAHDYQYLLPYKEELKLSIPSDVELKIIPDRTYTGLGCIIQTPNGSYDVTIDSQLNEVKKQLIAFYEESVNQ